MPIYAYKCEHNLTHTEAAMIHDNALYTGPCGHEYEVFYQNHAAVDREEANEVCPLCGGKEKERLINTGTSHILKGRGWARDGY